VTVPAPVGILRIRVEQAEICDDVFLVVNGQRGLGGAVSATSGLSGGLCMGVLAIGCRSTTFALDSWHIDDREAVAPCLTCAQMPGPVPL